jgi:hypothetical protein
MPRNKKVRDEKSKKKVNGIISQLNSCPSLKMENIERLKGNLIS